MLVADKLKSSLYGGPLNYVLSLEGEEWFAPEKVATLSDIYVNSRSDHEVERASVTTATTFTGSRPVHKHNAEGYRSGHNTHNTSPARRCYECKALGHIARDCPRNRGAVSPRSQHSGYHNQPNRARVNLCTTRSAKVTHEVGVQYDLPPTDAMNHCDVRSVAAVESTPDVKMYPLQFVGVNIAGYECIALDDSGTQLPVVSERLFGWCKNNTVGSVQLHGFGRGHTIQAPLVNLPIGVSNVNGGHRHNSITVMCAIADFEATDYDVILPSHVVREIQQLPDNLPLQGVANYTPTDNNQETNSPIIQEEIIEDNRVDNSSVRVELNEDEPFSGDSGKVNSEVGSTLSQEVKCPLSVAPAQIRKYDILYGDAQLLLFRIFV